MFNFSLEKQIKQNGWEKKGSDQQVTQVLIV